MIGEWGEERLASQLNAIFNIEDFGAGENSEIPDRMYAALMSDMTVHNQLSELGVLSFPFATKMLAEKVFSDKPIEIEKPEAPVIAPEKPAEPIKPEIKPKVPEAPTLPVTEGEVEEKQLDQRRRVAKELNIALDEKTQESKRRALQPGPDEADDDAKDDAEHRKIKGRDHAFDDPVPLTRLVEKDKVPLRVGFRQIAKIRLNCLNHRPDRPPIPDACRTGDSGAPARAPRRRSLLLLAFQPVA